MSWQRLQSSSRCNQRQCMSLPRLWRWERLDMWNLWSRLSIRKCMLPKTSMSGCSLWMWPIPRALCFARNTGEQQYLRLSKLWGPEVGPVQNVVSIPKLYSFVHTCTKLITVLKFFSMLPLLASCSASLFWFHLQDEEFWDCSNCTCPTICGIGAVPCGTPEDRLLDTPIQCPGSVDPVTWKCLKVHKLKVDRRNMPMFIDFLTVDVARF